jgi:3-phosphoshikimate 1-carboxyvinyltransferase
LQTLTIKETDRITALITELRKLGIVLRVENGTDLVWDGERCEKSDEPIDTYDDHRMAMSLAPLALIRPSLAVRNPQVVTKSYPHFWEELQKAGFEVVES